MCVCVCVCVYVCVNTKVRCKPRNKTNFNQKVKMLKTSNFRYDTETKLCQNYTTIYQKTSKFTSVKKLLKSIVPTRII